MLHTGSEYCINEIENTFFRMELLNEINIILISPKKNINKPSRIALLVEQPFQRKNYCLILYIPSIAAEFFLLCGYVV